MSESERITLRLPAGLARALRLAAADSNESQSDVMARALRLLFSRKAPPGYEPPAKGPDLSPPAALRQARKLRSKGLSYAKVAEQLNREGYRTKQGANWSGVNLQQQLRRKGSK